ncbi:MAG: hypothetical protein QF437_05380, partial [Planctomycetota bacterium]|nr:hypothetical protein [Planctomycetota bacterium]
MTYREKLKEEGWFVARGILDGEDICTAKDRLRLVCEHVDFCRERINIIREVSVPERDRIPDNQRRLTDAVRDFENCKRKSTAGYFDRLKSFDDKKSRSTISRTAFCLIGRGDCTKFEPAEQIVLTFLQPFQQSPEPELL